MKTAVSIPDPLFAAADRAAERLHLSRSELYCRALSAYLQQLPAASVTDQLDAFYAAHPELNALEPGWAAAQAEVLGRESW